MSDPRDRKRYYDRMTLTRSAVTTIARALLPLVARYRAQGAEHVPYLGACILAANHLTNYDVFPMQLVLSRPIFFMGKAELHRHPLLDAFIRRLGSFPVERGAPDPWALHRAAWLLAQGRLLGMFPEGRRSHGRGLRVGKTGVARLALQARCPVIPAGLTGTDQILGRFPRRTEVTVRFGPPILPGEDEGAVELTDRLMYAIAGLLPPQLRGVYAQAPPALRIASASPGHRGRARAPSSMG